MKYYIDGRGEIFAYEEDGSQDDLIGDKQPLTKDEVDAILNPEPTNEEKRKAALLALSAQYQSDISQLNNAWVAAAVSDGVNETAKKDAVISQINDRKAKYATDRAAIIAQYPEA